jgi:hypothetical protein
MVIENTGIPPHPAALPSGLPPEDMVLTYAEAGAYLRCTRRQVRRLVEEGRLGSSGTASAESASWVGTFACSLPLRRNSPLTHSPPLDRASKC